MISENQKDKKKMFFSDKKIDQIFSSELNKNRNLILTKPKASNTLIKNKCKNKIEDNFGIFKDDDLCICMKKEFKTMIF